MAYALVLIVHSWLRWVVLLLGLLLCVRSFAGARAGATWQPGHERLCKGFLHTLNLQFVLGVLLLFVLSPITGAAFADMGAAMKQPVLRFFAVEHTVTMFLAIGVAHVGRARARRAEGSARLRTTFRFQLAWLLLTFLAIPWPWLDVGRPLFRF